MTIKLNIDKLDPHQISPTGSTDTQTQRPAPRDATSGQIAAGRYVLQIGDPSGVAIREASRAERAHIRPRATPILHRPRLMRGLVGRHQELVAALSGIDAALPIEVSGDHGTGKTAFLRHLAHHPRASSFVDGVVYLSARHESSADLQQLIFDAFHESDPICKPTEAEMRRGLQEKQALILLDDVQLPQNELEHLIDIAPRSTFAVATRERCLWGEVRSIALKGLPPEDAVLLLEREIERPLDDDERAAAASVCTMLEGHPLRIQQAAALTREQGICGAGWTKHVSPAAVITDLIAGTDDKQRRVLLALTALPGVPLQLEHIAYIAEVTDIEPALMSLARRGLVVSTQSRHQLAHGVADRLRRTEDLRPWLNRAITYFTAWVERNRRSADTLLDEFEALLVVQQTALEHRRCGEVLQLARQLDGTIVMAARWGAWALSLENCLAAAKARGDGASEAWALHQSGSRAFCLGEPVVARRLLNQAVKLREGLNDEDAAAASRRNISVILALQPDEPSEPASISPVPPASEPAPDVDFMWGREETPQPAVAPAPAPKGFNPMPFIVFLISILAGFALWTWALASFFP